MNVIDKILNEWSFRCHDGIVDMNNPTKLSILKEILIEEGIEDDILDATLNLSKDDPASEEKKRKVLAILTGTSSDEKYKEEIDSLTKLLDGSKQEKEKKAKALIAIEDELEKRNLKFSTAAQIIRTFARADEEEKLINYFGENGKNLPRLEVKDGINIKAIPQERLNKDIINKLYKDLSGSSGTKGVGKEENFLVAFYNNVFKTEKKGDIVVDGQKYEVKGVGAMVTPPDVGRGSKKDVIQLLSDEFLPKLKLDPTKLPTETFQEGTRWTKTISDLYNQYEQKNDFIKEINTVLNKKYPGIVINNEVLKNETNFSLAIAKNLINNFDIEKDEKIMFVSPDGEIKIYNTKEDIINAINKNEIKISAFSDFVPRLTLPKRKEKIKIGISNFKENVKDNKVSRKWYNEHKNEQKYFDETKSRENFIPLKVEYQDIVELVPYTSLEEELTSHLIESFK